MANWKTNIQAKAGQGILALLRFDLCIAIADVIIDRSLKKRGAAMNPSASTLLDAALSLPELERLAMAEALLSSLPDNAEEVDEAAFEQDLVRRCEEMENDPSICIPWSELKKQR